MMIKTWEPGKKKLIIFHWSSNNQTTMLENFLLHSSLICTVRCTSHILHWIWHTNTPCNNLIFTPIKVIDWCQTRLFYMILLQFYQLLMIEKIQQIKNKYKNYVTKRVIIYMWIFSVSAVHGLLAYKAGGENPKDQKVIPIKNPPVKLPARYTLFLKNLFSCKQN